MDTLAPLPGLHDPERGGRCWDGLRSHGQFQGVSKGITYASRVLPDTAKEGWRTFNPLMLYA